LTVLTVSDGPLQKRTSVKETASRIRHVHQAADGTIGVDVVVVREGRNFKSRLLALLRSSVGKRSWVNGSGKTVRAIEARRYGPSPAYSQAPAMGLVS
jgi:hypothetical protein